MGRKSIIAALAAIAIVLLVVLFLVVLHPWTSFETPSSSEAQLSTPAESQEDGPYTDEQRAVARKVVEAQQKAQDVDEEEIPSALAKARKKNADTVAWIYVPGTNVSLPVMRNDDDADYYYTHGSDGSQFGLGSIYMEPANSGDFDDNITVLYGHTFSDAEVMFTQLHRFNDNEFFDKHDSFFVYLPDGTKLTYRIVSTCKYTDANIVEEYGSAKGAELQGYFNFACSPGTGDANVREGVKAVAGVDRIVQLSTCDAPVVEGERYIVTGLLVDEDEG